MPSAEIGTFTNSNDDTLRIMEEASAVVEMNMKSKFPDLPASSAPAKSLEAAGF
jgi:hypothetical protein